MYLKPPAAVLDLTAAPVARGTMLLAALGLLAPLALYLATARSIVDIWNSSDTFAHGYAIVPISLWLVWRRRENFTLIPPSPWWPALGALALAGAAWLAGALGEVQVVMQYAFVAMIPLAALALLGPRLAGTLAFPLLFLLFAVPFGEIFVNPLINFTADFTVAAVRATGIPVLRSGTRFELPTGTWSVVEACSGIRYLISSLTLGCLYACLTYRSTARRLMFVGLSVVVPIVANGLRAYMIVMIGHTSGMSLATGVDHLIYGWLFFGVVMFVMFWIGSYWREDAPPVPRASARVPAVMPATPQHMAAMAAAVLAVAALWPGAERYIDHANADPRAVKLAPMSVDWPGAPAFTTWTPRFMEPDARFDGTYRSGSLAPVSLAVLYYRNQDKGKALISSLNRLTGPKDAWHQTGSTLRTETIDGRPFALRESTLSGPGGSLLVWHWMWVGGRYTASDYAGKLWQARAKLMLMGDDGAAVMVAAPFQDTPEQARSALRAFVTGQFKAVDKALASTKED